jgi:excisionase family DNA binding protein
MTRSEAARSLQISLKKLDGLIADGTLPVIRMGRSIRIRPEALNAFAASMESKPTRRKP